VGPTVLLLQAEDLLVVIGQPFTIADIECDVSDPRFRHGHLDSRWCRSAGARSVPVGRGNEAGKLSPAHSLFRVLDAERMVDELDHVAVRVVDGGVGLSGILAAAQLPNGANDVGYEPACRRPRVADSEDVE